MNRETCIGWHLARSLSRPWLTEMRYSHFYYFCNGHKAMRRNERKTKCGLSHLHDGNNFSCSAALRCNTIFWVRSFGCMRNCDMDTRREHDPNETDVIFLPKETWPKKDKTHRYHRRPHNSNEWHWCWCRILRVY